MTQMVATAASPQKMAEVVKELERIKRVKKDYIVPHSRIRLDLELLADGKPENGSIIVAADHTNAQTHTALQGQQYEDFFPTPLALEQLCVEKLGINPPYFRRLQSEAHDLLVLNTNYWLEHDARNFMLRTLEGTLRAVLSDQFRRLDNYDLFFKAFDILHACAAQITSIELSDEKFYVHAAHPTLRINLNADKLLAPEDWVHAAIRISNSEVGRGGLEVAPGLVRVKHQIRIPLKKNTDDDLTVRQIHLGARLRAGVLSQQTEDLADKTFWSGVQDVIKAIFTEDKFKALVTNFQEVVAQELDNIVDAIDTVSKELQLSDDRKKALLNIMAAGADTTLLGLITAVAQAAGAAQDVDEQARLETYAGKMAEGPPGGVKIKKQPEAPQLVATNAAASRSSKGATVVTERQCEAVNAFVHGGTVEVFDGPCGAPILTDGPCTECTHQRNPGHHLAPAGPACEECWNGSGFDVPRHAYTPSCEAGHPQPAEEQG